MSRTMTHISKKIHELVRKYIIFFLLIRLILVTLGGKKLIDYAASFIKFILSFKLSNSINQK